MYKAAYGDTTGTSTYGGSHQLSVPIVHFDEFLPDTQKIGLGVIVGQTGWEYLRRSPNSGQDMDYTGYDFWLQRLNSFNGNWEQAEMVKAFITSIEYRQRFGQV